MFVLDTVSVLRMHSSEPCRTDNSGYVFCFVSSLPGFLFLHQFSLIDCCTPPNSNPCWFCCKVSKLTCFHCLSNEVDFASRQAEGGRYSHTQAVSMAPYDHTEMPWAPCPTHIKGRILEAFPTFRLSGLRVAIRGRMPVVEDHEVRYEVVAAEEGMWTEDSDEDDDLVGDGSDGIADSLGAVIESVLVTLPALPNPRFLVRMVTEEAEEKSLPRSGENPSRIAVDANSEVHPSPSAE